MFKFSIIVVLFSALYINSSYGNWDKVMIEVTAACTDCYYFANVTAPVTKKDLNVSMKSIAVLSGQVSDENRRVWRQADSTIKTIDASYANVLGCLWTERVNSFKECSNKVSVLQKTLENQASGERRLDQTDAEYQQAIGAILRRIFGAAFRVTRRVIQQAPKIFRGIRKIMNTRAFKIFRRTLVLVEIGAFAYTVYEMINLNSQSKELQELNNQLRLLAGKEIGFISGSHELTCDGKGKRDRTANYHYFYYKCTGTNFDDDYDVDF